MLQGRSPLPVSSKSALYGIREGESLVRQQHHPVEVGLFLCCSKGIGAFGPIHTGRARANSNANPLMLLACGYSHSHQQVPFACVVRARPVWMRPLCCSKSEILVFLGGGGLVGTTRTTTRSRRQCDSTQVTSKACSTILSPCVCTLHAGLESNNSWILSASFSRMFSPSAKHTGQLATLLLFMLIFFIKCQNGQLGRSK